ncbi:ferrous iron transporter B [Acutalibacter muris]|uniref:Ferrous iron transporter B n=1 Tax=Acutalibacter muris TaxID=1796620 RepID=A0A1Z2XNE1_9FIRM|nr:ferrous iron transporter B [Acutalibacter muris]ANU53358.1 ferrous iron transporter B [Hungateiclostridiaceae bacterium KB18]ASB39970.1 ferrous iron transporter B [Acutalibacter muris]QQR29258.1 ferrous iron transporter B [Acutalibacter muris]
MEQSNAVPGGLAIKKREDSDRVIALCGNPNVGKSTIFNALTNLHQHTGNWPGKTVANAQGYCRHKERGYLLVDLPGCYSLQAHSAEEEAARDFLLSGSPDCTVAVCDATCLERNMNLVLQVLELTPNLIVCVNLLDEAKRKGVRVDLAKLSELLGTPVVGASARDGKGLSELMDEVEKLCHEPKPPRELPETDPEMRVHQAQWISEAAVSLEPQNRSISRDRKLDRILTSPLTGFPIMLLLLLGIFWLTITGANYPSALLSEGLFWLGDRIRDRFIYLGSPEWLTGLVCDGMYRTLSWVVAVMLPPMAIFFPLFTLLEDFGYLPRVAFNLDRCFKSCGACGKQALTTCMGFGCNAAGVVGCRIIDSPRERLIAMLTNNFVPCNGRLPMLISLITMFFVGAAGGLGASVLSSAMLVGLIALGLLMTLAVSKFLSATLLKGVPSSFTLELPPYRRPQLGKVIVRSIFDRTLFVLGRAASVAAPAGLIIWLLANIHAGGDTLLAHCAGFLDPFARVFGLDGVILLAFILGLPANEIVIPLIIMAYLSQGSLVELSDLTALRSLLIDNGWTWVTALCVMVFSLMHWPCSTTCLTIKKESGSWKWTAAAVAIPTVCGLILCFLIANACRLLGIG